METIAEENIMTPISTFCVLSSTLAVIALSANGASAATITVPVPRVIVHVPQPKVTVHTPQPKVTVHTPQLKILSNHGITDTGAKVVRPGDGNQPVPAGGPPVINWGDGNNTVNIIGPPPVPLGGVGSLSVVGHTFSPVSGPLVIDWGDGNNTVNIIGPTVPLGGVGNGISDNVVQGNLIGRNPSSGGSSGDGILIGRNPSSGGSSGDGISDNVVQGNLIGRNPSSGGSSGDGILIGRNPSSGLIGSRTGGGSKDFDSSSPTLLNETQHDNTIGGTTGGGGDFKLPPGPSQQIYNTSNTPTGGVADRESSVPSVSEIVITKDQDQSSTNILGEAAKGTSNFNPGGALKQYDSSLTKFLNETLHNNTVGGTTGGGGILKEGDLTSPNAVKGTGTTNINQGDPDRPVNIGSEYNGGGTAIGGGGTANLKQFDSSSPKILNETQHDNTIGGPGNVISGSSGGGSKDFDSSSPNKNNIQLDSFSWGASNPVSVGGGDAGKAGKSSVSNISVVGPTKGLPKLKRYFPPK